MVAQRTDWKNIVAEYAQSGLTGAEFCRTKRIPLSSFYKHKKNHLPDEAKSQQPSSQKSIPESLPEDIPKPSPLKEPVEFVDLTEKICPSQNDQALLRITSPSGFTLEVFL